MLKNAGRMLSRQAIGDVRLELGNQARGFTANRDVSDEVFAARQVIALHNHGLFDRGMLSKVSFDVVEFHPDPAEFDLEVRTSKTLKFSILRPASEVARAVNSPKFALHEFLRGERLLFVVTTGQAVSTNVEVTNESSWNWLHVRIEHVNCRVRDRFTNRNCAFARFDLLDRTPNRGFGRTVEVPDFARFFSNLVCEIARKRFTAGEDAQIGFSIPTAVDHHAPSCWSCLHHGDVELIEHVAKVTSVLHFVAGRNYGFRASDERQVKFEERDVEAKGRYRK